MPIETKYAVPDHAVELMRRVEKLILEEPKRYQQSSWIRESQRAPCHTAACIGGWLVALHTADLEGVELRVVLSSLKYGYYHSGYFFRKASEILGVSAFSLKNLFSGDPGMEWPEPYRSEWTRITNSCGSLDDFIIDDLAYWEAKAKLAVARIEHWLVTGV